MISEQSLLWIVIIVGIPFAFFMGWIAGTVAENKLWMDAVCGRERIYRAVQRFNPTDTEAKHG